VSYSEGRHRSPEEYDNIHDTTSLSTKLIMEDDASTTFSASSPSNIEISTNVAESEVVEPSLDEPILHINQDQDQEEDQDQEDTDEDEDESPYEILDAEEGLENIPSASELEMVDWNIQDIQEDVGFQLKNRNDVYHEIYEDAKRKAEEARNLAISAHLEAKRIKELYMLQ